jgi:3-deoxy-manno-octulosonate cytidylyltransferase (CMP-KDO synthetase)
MADVPDVTVVIPARFGSTRFPGKPLAPLAGKPLIQHVYERTVASHGVSRVIVATDDRRIADAVRAFDGAVLLVDGPYRTGTDRVAAVARQVPGDVFINLQGDEIALHPQLIGDLAMPFPSSGAAIGTLVRRLGPNEKVGDHGIVKAVVDARGFALYFSRAPIPHVRDGWDGRPVAGLHVIHLGIYAFTREALLRFAELPTGRLEEAEKLEQLRALEHGMPIRVWETTHASLRIDSPDDLEEASRVLKRVEAQVSR